MVDLIVVCSVTLQDCYEISFKKYLEIIGIPYKLILTDPNLSLSQSYNSIIETNLEDIKQSKYIIFSGQDVLIKDENWGRKLIAVCDSLPDFGYGGVECRCSNKEKIGYYKDGRNEDPPKEVMTCDGAFIIITSKLFLERQFDTQFPWYPLAEDYALWVRFVKGLKVYHIPIIGYGCGENCSVPSKWVSQFANISEYSNSLRKDHERLLKKWNLKEVITTSWG
jgi:hypothetical protein